MSTLAGQGQERPLQMASQNIGASGFHFGAHIADIAADDVHGIGNQRQHLTSRAMHGMPGTSHIDAIRAVIEALLPCTVRVNVHIARSQDSPFGIHHCITVSGVDAHRAAILFESLIAHTGCHDGTGCVGHDPIPTLFAARIHLAGIANGHRSRCAFQCRRHTGDNFFPIRHMQFLHVVAPPERGANQ